MTHEKIDASEKVSMNSSLVAKIVCLADVLLPDAALGFSVKEVLKTMKEDGLYASKRWKDWPEVLKPGQEKEMNEFLESIRSAMDTSLLKIAKRNAEKYSVVDRPDSQIPSVNEPTSAVSTSSPASGTPTATSLSKPVNTEDASRHSSSNSTDPSHIKPLRKISCATHKKAPGGELSKRFPDHIVVKLLVNILTVLWKQIDAIIELKYIKSDQTFSNARFQVWQYAKFIFRNQHNRRFVLGVMLLGSTMVLMYIDRSGVLISSTFDINDKPLLFLRVVAGLTYADDKYLGYDTTISVDSKKGNPTSATLSGIKYSVKNVVHAETGILGRGTVCLEVTDDLAEPSKKTTYALKDAWVDVSRAQKEAQILTKLNALNISNIPILVRHEVVQVNDVNDSTQNIRDVINKKRKKLQQAKQPRVVFIGAHEDREKTVEGKRPDAKDVAPKPAAAPADAQAKDKDKVIKPKKQKRSWYNYYAREHHRLLIWPFGRPLTAFRCLEELLLGIRDIIGVIQQLKSAGYLHRDISINNVVLAANDKKLVELLKNQGIDCHSNACAVLPRGEGEDEDSSLDEGTANDDECNKSDVGCTLTATDLLAAVESKISLPEEVRKRLEGFLIDFDYSIFAEGEDTSALADRTGTVPFMAIDVLRAPRLHLDHEYYHDLESLFYVLCWVCTVSAGPSVGRPSKEYPNSVVRGWNEEEPTEKGMERVADSKEVNMKTDKTFGRIIEDFHEYFEPIFGCILGLRKCLFPIFQEDEEVANEFKSSHDQLKSDIKTSGGADDAQLKELKKRRLRIPLGQRDAKDVFQDLYDVIDEAVSALPAEHTLAALKDTAPEPHDGAAAESEVDNCSTMACSSEYLDKYMAVRDPDDEDGDVLTHMASFSSKVISKQAEPADPSAPQATGTNDSTGSHRFKFKRKSYNEDTDDDETTNTSSSSRKKLKVAAVKAKSESAAVVRKSKQQRLDEAEFVPDS
ncbi:hypothetical protein SCHPADRAFT_882422 [Schizopora paradoxa]|uniref:Fungal-type protein kinase domain-containing protein n=1 Tax=Schizopora paradoxa TaxID=27342 RepID=A0A0H2RBA1_9AGAM|nr:hypothetical protein SCHPADRAFT_882422 [Schizopora paradoxa]